MLHKFAASGKFATSVYDAGSNFPLISMAQVINNDKHNHIAGTLN
jgi:hypothetical protein